jgi:hypothetical protein
MHTYIHIVQAVNYPYHSKSRKNANTVIQELFIHHCIYNFYVILSNGGSLRPGLHRNPWQTYILFSRLCANYPTSVYDDDDDDVYLE